MTDFSRRAVLTGAAASAAVLGTAAATSTGEAAAPASGRQVPSFYRFKVGDYEITTILDGVRRVKLERSPTRSAKLEQVQALLAASHLPTDQIGIYFHPNVVNTGSKLVLIDTGNGPRGLPSTGMTAATLAAAGVDAGAIDLVIISHFHGDHIGGLRTADGKLAFPNAEIKVPAKEWAYWMDDGNMSRAPQARQAGFQNVRRMFAGLADQVTRYEWGAEVGPGITALDTNGHTPGHTSFAIASGSGKMVIQADVTSGYAPLFVTNPDWHPGGDVDGAQGARTRRKLYDMLATDRILLSGYHFPFPALGYMEKAGSGYRMVPVHWNPTL